MHSHLLRAHSNCNTCTLLVVCNKCRCTHAILQPTVISICRLPAIPPPAMPDRRWYQYWPSWHNYGTKRFWERISKEPWNALELIAQRLFSAGLECPAEATSADITAAIVVLQRGPAAAAMATTEELTEVFSAFKVRSARMHAPRHPSNIKIFAVITAAVLVQFTLCASAPYPYFPGAHQAARR